MTIEKKLLGTSPSGDAANVADVFSTFLYTGNNTGQTITNGIDLAGEGGLVWTKARDGTIHHALTDTVRGNTKFLEGSHTGSEETTTVGITAFNSNGYNLGADNTWKFNVNNAHVTKYVSWTFRKKKKFFDVVTYTGNGANRTIAHSLGGDVGMMFIKQTNATNDWIVYVKSLGNDKLMYLNLTNSIGNDPTGVMWNTTTPTND